MTYGTAMQAVRLIISKCGGLVHAQGQAHRYPPNCLVVTGNDTTVCDDSLGGDSVYFDFYAADFQSLHPEIVDLLDPQVPTIFLRDPIRLVRAESDVIGVITLLAKSAPATFLHFVYVYCLGLDRRYFSSLMHHCMSGDKLFCDFIEANFLNQWPVARLAQEFGLPLRKFNILFQEIYGSPAKQWLLERRLAHARGLLLSTPMRVLDVALECGFSNHGHFTDSFRKRFLCSPKQFRLTAAGKFSAAF